MITLNSSQVVREILEICEAYGMPKNMVQLVKKKCWKLADYGKEEE